MDDQFPVEVEKEEVKEILTPRDAGWQEYVFSLMTEAEFTNDCPNIDGLRRMALTLLGPYDITMKTLQVPGPNNEGHASVRCRLQFTDRTVDGLADSYSGNTKKYANYSLAIADTRAESRALRRALFIKKVAAEELDSHDESAAGTRTGPEKINDAQIMGLDLQCKRANINVKKLIENVAQARYNSVTELSYDTATLIVNRIGELIRTEVPVELLGYEADWKATFGN